MMKTTSGLTLVEVTLAMAVVSLSVVVILGLLPIGIDSGRQTSDEIIVSKLAQDMMSWRRATPYNKKPWFPSSAVGLLITDRNNVCTNYFDANGFVASTQFPRYEVRYTVVDHPLFPSNEAIARVVLTIRWPLIATNPPALSPSHNTRVVVSQFTRGGETIQSNITTGMTVTNWGTL